MAPRCHELILIRLLYPRMISFLHPLKTPHYHILMTTYLFNDIFSSKIEHFWIFNIYSITKLDIVDHLAYKC